MFNKKWGYRTLVDVLLLLLSYIFFLKITIVSVTGILSSLVDDS